MQLSVSFLGIKDNLKEKLSKLAQTNLDYLHLDIMDNNFVPNQTSSFLDMKELLNGIDKPLDVHLMVSDVISYIDQYKQLNPAYITFHLEAVTEPMEVIDYIKKNNIQVGISIKPSTDINRLIPYLKYLDLVLLMSVEPGFGGQPFLPSTKERLSTLVTLKDQHNFVIEVDGGINAQTISLCDGADIVVVGSFITNGNDYQSQIDLLKLKNNS